MEEKEVGVDPVKVLRSSGAILCNIDRLSLRGFYKIRLDQI